MVSGDILNTGGSGLDTGGFREKVTELSETSLERLYRCPVERLDSPSGPRFHPLSP